MSGSDRAVVRSRIARWSAKFLNILGRWIFYDQKPRLRNDIDRSLDTLNYHLITIISNK